MPRFSPISLAIALSLGALSCADDDAGTPPGDNSDAGSDGGTSSAPASRRPQPGLTSRLRQDAGAGESDDAAAADPNDPVATEQQLEQLLAAYNASVEAECECLWAAPGYEYESVEDCVESSSLGDVLEDCYRQAFADATQSVVECKADAEEAFQECIMELCEDGGDIPCADDWATDDERCAPSLADRFYQDCIEGS